MADAAAAPLPSLLFYIQMNLLVGCTLHDERRRTDGRCQLKQTKGGGDKFIVTSASQLSNPPSENNYFSFCYKNSTAVGNFFFFKKMFSSISAVNQGGDTKDASRTTSLSCVRTSR